VTASLSVLQALAVTAELTQTPLSAAGAKVMAEDLAAYPEHQVLGALSRCRKEVRGKLTVHDVVSRLDDGRPGPEEAWAMLPMDERQTVVWTDDMTAAWGVALPLVEEGDRIAARMAFLETYRARVQKARDQGEPVKWTVSIGSDATAREGAIEEAIRLGRLKREHALQLGYTGPSAIDPKVVRLAAAAMKRLGRDE
jgi:hypothetical protein